MNEACSCIWVDDGDVPCAFASSRVVTARKEHRCTECNETISKGAQYEYVCGKWDGQFQVFRTCETCLSIRDVFFCDGWQYAGLWIYLDEHIRELNGDIPSECLVKLSSAARAVVCDKIEEEWRRTYDEEEEQ